jgi:uncharacterized protein YqgQ
MGQLSLVEVKDLLRSFGIVIYTGDALGDYLLMEDELKELHEAGLIADPDIFKAALLTIRKRVSELNQRST